MNIAGRCAPLLLIATALPAAAALPPPHIGGNLQYDGLWFNDAPATAQDFRDWRRQRLSVEWKPHAALTLKAEFDKSSERWTDAFVQWNSSLGQWRVGQFKQPFHFDTLISDRHTLLMENSAIAVFGIDRRVGADYRYGTQDWTVALSAFGQDLTGQFAGHGAAARATWTPFAGDARVWHIGAALAQDDPDSTRYSLRARPESGLGSYRLSGPGALEDVEELRRAGIESLWLQGPWTLQMELDRLWIDRGNEREVRADGGYLTVARVLTGQSRGYKQGLMSGVDLSGGGTALEAALRYGRIEYQGGAPGDGQESLSAGLTWHFPGERRVMLNYVAAERFGVVNPPSVRLLEARLQFSF